MVLNYSSILYFFVEKSNPYVSTRFNMVNHKIINLAHSNGNRDAINKEYFEQEVQKSHIKPSHKTNQFAHLMQNNLEWSNVIPGGNSFNMTKIADLSPEQGNIHCYNHKVIYNTMIKKIHRRVIVTKCASNVSD